MNDWIKKAFKVFLTCMIIAVPLQLIARAALKNGHILESGILLVVVFIELAMFYCAMLYYISKRPKENNNDRSKL